MSISRVRMVDFISEESSIAFEDFMANWKVSIKDAIYLHGPVSLNYSKDKVK